MSSTACLVKKRNNIWYVFRALWARIVKPRDCNEKPHEKLYDEIRAYIVSLLEQANSGAQRTSPIVYREGSSMGWIYITRGDDTLFIIVGIGPTIRLKYKKGTEYSPEYKLNGGSKAVALDYVRHFLED